MRPMWLTTLMFFLLVGAFLSPQGSAFPLYAASGEGVDRCEEGTLPQAVRSRLKQEFATWKIQTPAALSPSARKRWEAEKPAHCPGIAVGRFDNAKALSYAILLVSRGDIDKGYRFLVFSPKDGQRSYEMRVVDSGESDGSHFFTCAVRMSKFFNKESRKKFQAYTSDGILLLDAAEQEYEVDVYFWANGNYQHQPVDY